MMAMDPLSKISIYIQKIWGIPLPVQVLEVPLTPIAILLYKNRLILIDAENRNKRWYSKTTLPNTPVEMSDLFTQAADPRFGEQAALAIMDDKLIVFKANAIFYQTGDGPDSTGANNDFTE